MRITYFHYLFDEKLALLHVNQFSNAARALGHDISVHAMNLAPNDNGDSVRQTTRQWMKTRLSRFLHEPKELAWNPRYALRELAIVRAERPDVVLVRDHHLSCGEVAVRALTGIPLVLEVNAPAYESARYFDEYMHIPGAGFITERLKLRTADRVVVVSQALRSHLLERHHLPPDKITANPNGADCERFHPDVDGSAIRTRYALGNDLVVGLVASLHKWHGPELLKLMIESLYRPGVRFLLVGRGPGWNDLRQWVAQRTYGDRVAIVGGIPHDDVPAHVAAMDVTLVPESNFYGSSLKTLEYMAAGRPTVAPNYGPFAEVIDHGTHGLLFAPRDVRGAIDAIETLLADAPLRQRLGRNARQRVVQELTWQHNAQRVIDACTAARADCCAMEAVLQ